MKKLTIVIDAWGHNELKEYLLSLKGIIDVNINNDKDLEITIWYDHNLISTKIINLEIFAFLNISKTPSLLSFDKHSDQKLSTYKIIREEICCEYCFKSTVEDLFNISGIEKVESNFINSYYRKRSDGEKTIIIYIYYNENIIHYDEIKNLELNLNI